MVRSGVAFSLEEVGGQSEVEEITSAKAQSIMGNSEEGPPHAANIRGSTIWACAFAS